MTDPQNTTPILARFLELCERPPDRPLGLLDYDDDVRAISADPEYVLSRLVDEFAATELVASGVAIASEEGLLSLAPPLVAGPFIVLRHALDKTPFDLLTDAGCLSPDRLPAFQSLLDFRTQKSLGDGDGVLYAAFSVADAVLLRAARLPATIALGLDALPLAQVDRFCKKFVDEDLKSVEGSLAAKAADIDDDDEEDQELAPDDDAPHLQVSARLVLVGWTPSEVSSAVPSQLQLVIDCFNRLRRLVDFNPSGVTVWQPSEEDIERLKFIVDQRCAKMFRHALADSADGAEFLGSGAVKPKKLGPPAGLPAALAQLHEATFSPAALSLEIWKSRFVDVETQLDEQVFNPLVACALATPDPIVRNLYLGFAGISRLFHSQALLLSERLKRTVYERGAEGLDLIPKDNFKSLLALADRLIAMTQVIEQCIPSSTTIPSQLTIESQPIPRLRDCG